MLAFHLTFLNRENVSSIIREHREQYLYDDDNRVFLIRVRREMIWEDSVTQLKHFNDKEHFSVSFIGEPGADGGGLKREFFSIMLKKIQKNNSLLDGSPEFGQVVRHNTIALQEGLFLFMGKLFAMSIVHGGPSPTFFARSIVEYLLEDLRMYVWIYARFQTLISGNCWKRY